MSARSNDTDLSLYAAVLAAGRSRRFGSTKQVARFRGSPLISYAMRAAEAACGERTLLVAGCDWQRVHAACQPLKGFLLLNDRYAEGLASSIVATARVLPDSADGILLLLGDQPLVDANDLKQLIETWSEHPERIVCSQFASRLAPPAIFPRRLFGELLELEGDQGAYPVIARHRDATITVASPHAEFDVDTPAVLEELDRQPD